ncbi:hypothetical protein A3D77_00935 [Candidatus Gottesmanbacteria bacterium RIFCSPHIGHO2_02_FULL_39_11]|uniref:ATP-grasp domain-containing protein n=1 Tax=Candidatus Gottesmanbacteria bacterium RIFCSPHIGHO2_02_FULL_39_11 TaxID=1798382 RepID=A0A1F5ZPN1_9BACT|nr:MAG: hypothetical protein A3D77_00935 [Candidatus Gottesmanbacteria bacterium RIFCSPHIGHO2_02_FULL_39_11]
MLPRNKSVVILTNSYDDHAHSLVPEIEKLGGKVYRIDFDRLSTHFSFSFLLNVKKPSFECETPVGSFASKKIDSIWYRRPYDTIFTKDSIDNAINSREQDATIRSIADYFPKKTLIVDHPNIVRFASQRITQLMIAKKMSLRIPDTLTTTSINQANSFYDKHQGNIIVKDIATTYIRLGNEAKSFFTTRVENKSDLQLVKNCPTLLQEQIFKKAELRITIIGNKIFPIEFDSKQVKEAQVDFRKGIEKIIKLPHKLVKLPLVIEKKLFKLLKFYGLHFGAIDMAITPEGEYVFFELNPAGQFLWLEDLTGVPLASEMAKFLMGAQKMD